MSTVNEFTEDEWKKIAESINKREPESLAIELNHLFIALIHIIKIILRGLWKFFKDVAKKEPKP